MDAGAWIAIVGLGFTLISAIVVGAYKSGTLSSEHDRIKADLAQLTKKVERLETSVNWVKSFFMRRSRKEFGDSPASEGDE